MNKLRVQQRVNFHESDLTGRLSQVIKALQDAQKQLPEGVEAMLEIEAYERYGSVEWDASIYYYRDENDDEIAVRQRRERRAEAHERMQYEALKKKFGDA